MRVTSWEPSCLGVLALLLVLRSLDARSCRSDYNDLGSKTIRASLVFEGEAKSRISLADRPNVERVEFKIHQVLKGDRLKRSQVVVVGDFGQPDVDNCVAPEVTLDTRYLVFLDDKLLPGEKLPRGSSNRSSKNSGSLAYHVSSFPEASSGKAIKEVRNHACKECGRSPKITKEPKGRKELEGQRMRLHCRASGRPSPRISWFKDGVPLSKDSRITIKEHRRDSRLQIKNVGAMDSGTYHCQAMNLLGNSSSHEIRVNVKPVSEKPHSNLCPEQSYCLNGGTCYEVSRLKKQYCECAKNFVGLRCEEKLGSNAQLVTGKGIYYTKRKRKRHLHHHHF